MPVSVGTTLVDIIPFYHFLLYFCLAYHLLISTQLFGLAAVLVIMRPSSVTFCDDATVTMTRFH